MKILIIGGGIIGLAIAIELRRRGTSVTVLSRDFKEAAAHAAAGMLAPQAEAIPSGPMLDLCLHSRSLYPEWIAQLEAITGIQTGYWPCGILAPVYERGGWGDGEMGRWGDGESRREGAGEQGSRGAFFTQHSTLNTQHFLQHSTLNTQHSLLNTTWLDREQIHQFQPGLGSEVVGGWWYPEDAQVDNRALAQALWMAARELGVDICEGVAVEEIDRQHDKVKSVKTSAGEYKADRYVLATGAWSNQLLSVPVYPKKGQMLSVKVPSSDLKQLPLQQVLFGTESYIVPRSDGRIIVGATSEDVGFTPENTPAGIQALLSRAIRLYPQLQDFPIQEFWWGFRPATPDEMPILGESELDNLILATGHYRNGILLAPVTALLLSDLILHQKTAPLLAHFHYSRFDK
ncbi:MAG: glycine oxidase ThiO [Cyanosarcina radialis HA8281-LM2]|jgi:thiazole synthase|nr:glycine oxidase ThiO [Cyanosarcina radialis HA8281-LM2]